jgi:hypothetical protein
VTTGWEKILWRHLWTTFNWISGLTSWRDISESTRATNPSVVQLVTESLPDQITFHCTSRDIRSAGLPFGLFYCWRKEELLRPVLKKCVKTIKIFIYLFFSAYFWRMSVLYVPNMGVRTGASVFLNFFETNSVFICCFFRQKICFAPPPVIFVKYLKDYKIFKITLKTQSDVNNH